MCGRTLTKQARLWRQRTGHPLSDAVWHAELPSIRCYTISDSVCAPCKTIGIGSNLTSDPDHHREGIFLAAKLSAKT